MLNSSRVPTYRFFDGGGVSCVINLVQKAKLQQSDQYWSELPPLPLWFLLLRSSCRQIVCVSYPTRTLNIRILMRYGYQKVRGVRTVSRLSMNERPAVFPLHGRNHTRNTAFLLVGLIFLLKYLGMIKSVFWGQKICILMERRPKQWSLLHKAIRQATSLGR